MGLLDLIREDIRQKGRLSFKEFMHQALYTPNLGYYTSGLQKFGKQGDFITAPELTSLFGYTLANQCRPVLTGMRHPILFEFGAGSGQLCVDILSRLEQLDCLPQEYHILEVSGHLKARQRDLIAGRIPHLQDRVKWFSHWPTQPFNGVIIANEVFDAMPVHRFMQTEQGLLESYIALNRDDALQETFQPCTDERLISHVKSVLPASFCPYISEANLFIDDWFRQCAHILNQGVALILDYGFPRHEYYHPDRHTGTLMCHYQHQTHSNALIHVGEQDITAHVDFTHIAEAADAAGFHVAGYTNQASFLLGNGLLSLLEGVCEPDNIQQQQAVKQLLHPHEMGELFKVIAVTKQLDVVLSGFQLQDKRASL